MGLRDRDLAENVCRTVYWTVWDPKQAWPWARNGFEDVWVSFSPSKTIHRLANTFSHHLRKCLQDHYDGRSSYKSVD